MRKLITILTKTSLASFPGFSTLVEKVVKPGLMLIHCLTRTSDYLQRKSREAWANINTLPEKNFRLSTEKTDDIETVAFL